MDLITRYFLLWIILIGDPSNSEASVCGDNFEHPGTCLISDYGRSDVFLLKSIIKYARHDYVNTKCFSHIMHMWSGIENSELWAIKALDASGNYEGGFIAGNSQWLGSKFLCDNLNKAVHIPRTDRFGRTMREDLLTATAPFEFNFKTIFVQHQSSYQFHLPLLTQTLLHIGLCTPSSCSGDEIGNLTNIYFQEKADELERTFQMRGEVVFSKTLELPKDFYRKPGVIMLISLVMFTVIMTLLSFYNDKRTQSAPPQSIDDCQQPLSKSSNKILKCFSISTNFDEIWTTVEPSNSISTINGIRSIASLMALLSHIPWYALLSIKNSAFFYTIPDSLTGNWQVNAVHFVDCFFVISAFLHTRSYFSNMALQETVRRNGFWANFKIVCKMVLNRYIRLSVSHFILIIIGEVLWSYVNNTAPFINYGEDVACQTKWWKNILYIQNFDMPLNICVGWTYSSALEMQFHVLFSVGLILYTKSPKKMLKVLKWFTAFIFLSSLLIAIYIEFEFIFHVFFTTGFALYLLPWARVPPYIVGALAGWLSCRQDLEKIFSIDKRKKAEIMAIILVLASLHLGITRFLPQIMQCLFYTIHRFTFGTAISILILLNFVGYKSTLMNFLNRNYFVHFAKVSYGVFLINPLVITFFANTASSGHSYESIQIVRDTFGIIALTYLLGFAFILCFEWPYRKLINHFLSFKVVKKAQ